MSARGDTLALCESKMSKRPYTTSGRLGDVLALIQVLALDPDTRRSEEGLRKDLQGPPSSGENWFAVARQHRELFRVNEQLDSGVSLVARYVLRPDQNGKRPTLAPDFVSALITTAITLHDRQVSDADRWKSLIPLWAIIIGALSGSLMTNVINLFHNH